MTSDFDIGDILNTGGRAPFRDELWEALRKTTNRTFKEVIVPEAEARGEHEVVLSLMSALRNVTAEALANLIHNKVEIAVRNLAMVVDAAMCLIYAHHVCPDCGEAEVKGEHGH